MKFVKYLSLCLALLIVLGAGWYIYLGSQMPVLDAQERARLQNENHAHRFAELSEGTVPLSLRRRHNSANRRARARVFNTLLSVGCLYRPPHQSRVSGLSI